MAGGTSSCAWDDALKRIHLRRLRSELRFAQSYLERHLFMRRGFDKPTMPCQHTNNTHLYIRAHARTNTYAVSAKGPIRLRSARCWQGEEHLLLQILRRK